MPFNFSKLAFHLHKGKFYILKKLRVIICIAPEEPLCRVHTAPIPVTGETREAIWLPVELVHLQVGCSCSGECRSRCGNIP